MARRRKTEYPRVVYGPHGASMTITRGEDWPKGWSSTPARDDAPPTFAPNVVPLTRSELKSRLRAAGITFNESSADAELYRRLTSG